MVRAFTQLLVLITFLAPYALATGSVEDCKKELWGQQEYCKKYYAQPKTYYKYETVTKYKEPKTKYVTETKKEYQTYTDTKTKTKYFTTTPTSTKYRTIKKTETEKKYETKYSTYYNTKTEYKYETKYQTKTVYDKWGYHKRSLPTAAAQQLEARNNYHDVEKKYDHETIKKACYEIIYPEPVYKTKTKYATVTPYPKTETKYVTKTYKKTETDTEYKYATVTAHPYYVTKYETKFYTDYKTYYKTEKVEKDKYVYKTKYVTKTEYKTIKPKETPKKEKHWGRDILEIEAAAPQ